MTKKCHQSDPVAQLVEHLTFNPSGALPDTDFQSFTDSETPKIDQNSHKNSHNRNPLCIDIFCGAFGWGAGFAAEGWRVVGFDLEHHPWHNPIPDGCTKVLQDVLTLHGSQFRTADIIVASPPCQKYSYLAMPWSRSKSPHSQKAKALRREWETNGPDNRLFDACFRIQREACEASGHHIPMVVENVKGAQPWVGRATWSYGSFYLWGDVPALMPKALNRLGFKKLRTCEFCGYRFPDELGRYGCPNCNDEGLVGTKQPGLPGRRWFDDGIAKISSRSPRRKAASSRIAKIPFELASHIARVYRPERARYEAPSSELEEECF